MTCDSCFRAAAPRRWQPAVAGYRRWTGGTAGYQERYRRLNARPLTHWYPVGSPTVAPAVPSVSQNGPGQPAVEVPRFLRNGYRHRCPAATAGTGKKFKLFPDHDHGITGDNHSFASRGPRQRSNQ